jgi:hypothetical protein
MQPLEAEARDTEQRQADEARAVRDLRTLLKQRDSDLADLRRKLDLITAIDQAKLRPPKWLQPKVSAKGHHGTVSLMLTDTHFGEVVNPAEVDWLNAYDDEIAAKRLRRFTDKAIEMPRDYVSGIAYDGAVLFWGGDIFTGTIHDELLETNTETLYASVIRWIEPLAAMCYSLADAFGKLHCAVTFGNHGRRTKKPRGKQRAQDNIEWLLYKVLERETRHDKRITWQIPDAADTLVSIYSTRFLLTHGDQFRGGSGIAGALSPLMLGSHRKTRRAMASGRPYDVMVIGHFHQYLTLPGPVIVGGTLKGTDEYAYLGNFGYEPPRQAFWVTTPEKGVTISAPIDVFDRAAEGW